MSIYTAYDSEKAEHGNHCVLCDRCHTAKKTPTRSGMRLPRGWSTKWTRVGDRIDACPSCSFAERPFNCDNRVVNRRIQRQLEIYRNE